MILTRDDLDSLSSDPKGVIEIGKETCSFRGIEEAVEDDHGPDGSVVVLALHDPADTSVSGTEAGVGRWRIDNIGARRHIPDVKGVRRRGLSPPYDTPGGDVTRPRTDLP